MSKEGLELKKAIRLKGITQGEAAAELGMTRQNLNIYFSKDILPREFLQKVKSKLAIDLPRNDLSELKRKEEISEKSDYVKLLEDNDRFFKKILETNLAASERTQAAILAHVQAMVQMDVDRNAKNPEQKSELLQAWGRLIGGALGVAQGTSIEDTVKDTV